VGTALAASALLCAAAPAVSAATVSIGVPCARYAPGLAGQDWIPVAGSGFTPSTDPRFNAVELRYADGSLAAFTPLAADGSFSLAVLMPTSFIPSSGGRTRTYTLTATDRVTPGLAASTHLTLVRAGTAVQPARVRRLRRLVSWSVYGAPSGASMHAHWTFRGRRLASRKLGRARGPCGIVHKRAPFLPARPRNGTWRVYFTAGKRFSRRRALFYSDLRVFQALSSHPSATSAN
jgi:hypothetical protein